MAEVTAEFVVKQMEQYDCSYFTIKDSDRTSIIDEQQDSDVSTKQAIAQLQETLASINGNFVFVEISKKNRRQKANGGDVRAGHYSYRVNLNSNTKSINGGVNMADNAAYRALMEQNNALRLQIVEMKKDQEMDELRREIAEIKEGGRNPMLEQLMPAVIGYLGNSGTGAVAPGIAGTETEQEPSSNERLKAAFAKLKKVDPTYIDTICMLADFAEKKPEQYKGFLPMLKNML